MPSSVDPVAPPQKTYGRFSDGRSAGARDADVALGTAGLEITIASPYQRIVWPYATLRAGEPLRDHAVDVLLSSSGTPGASLFVPGKTFAAGLAARAPHLSARAERWRNARPWIALTAALAGFIVAVYVAGWSPLRTIAVTLPDSWRQRLGQQAISSITEGHKSCVAPKGIAALDVLTSRLASVSGTGRPFRVTVYDWDLMNAFAVPGDQIVMTRGLIEKVQSADELAGVLAHEMGHGISLHPETGIIRAIGLAAAVEVMMGGSSGALANFGLILAQLRSTRVAEREADLAALTLLKDARISPQGLGDFFKRIAETEKDDGPAGTFRQLDMLRTHPPTDERRALVARQQAYPSRPALDAELWSELKNVCSVTADPEKPSEESTETLL